MKSKRPEKAMGRVRTGIGGWTFRPWRGVFYPAGTRQGDELAFASRQVTAIEINGTYYSRQKPESFAKWAAETPDDFVFTLKGSRFVTNRRVLGSASEALDHFFGQGMEALHGKLGPILWQLMATKRFDPDDIARFVELLPSRVGDVALRHCLEPRHQSFADPRFVEICRDHGIAICLSDNEAWPLIADLTADFAYARLMRGDDSLPTCYPPPELDAWARRLAAYAAGQTPADLATLLPPTSAPPREVFAFLIHGGKVRAPQGARRLLELVGTAPTA